MRALRAIHSCWLIFALGGGLPAAAQAELSVHAEVQGRDLLVTVGEKDADTAPLLRAVWHLGHGSMDVQRPTTSGDATGRLMLDRFMEAALGAYLDAHLRFAHNGVRTDRPAAALADEMDAMVREAAAQFGAADLFQGFSAPTRQQLDRLCRIDWSQARFGVDGGAEQDKYLAIYFYVRTQRDELERQLRADLLPLAEVEVLGTEAQDPRYALRINSTCGTVFDEQNFLCALDLQLADTGNGAMDPELGRSLMQRMAERVEATPQAAAPAPRVPKRDRWLKQELDRINGRIDRMDQRKELWELRDRLDDMEHRITDLGLEVQEIKQQEGRADNPIAGLSELAGRNLIIRFARNSTALDAEYRVLLNEVFEQLARSPKERVLITGYTDRSGDPQVNLRLSEERAKAVRNYLLSRGIAAERLLLNYYGDSRSLGRDPGERRVEVEWLK